MLAGDKIQGFEGAEHLEGGAKVLLPLLQAFCLLQHHVSDSLVISSDVGIRAAFPGSKGLETIPATQRSNG